MAVHSGGKGIFAVGFKGVGGERQNGNLRKPGIGKGADGAGGGVAVHHRHLDIHQDQLNFSGAAGGHPVNGLLPIGGGYHREALGGQQLLGNLPVQGVVLYQQQGAVFRAEGTAAGELLPGFRMGSQREGQLDSEGGALPRCGGERNLSAHGIYQPLDNAKTQSGALNAGDGGGLRPLKAVKGLGDKILCHADAVVLDGEDKAGGGFCFANLIQTEFYGAAPGGEFLSVAQQIGDDLIQPQSVADHIRVLQMGVDGEGQAVFCHTLGKQIPCRADGAVQVKGRRRQLGLSAFDASQIQHIVDQLQQQIAGLTDFFQIAAHLFRLLAVAQRQIGEAQNGVHGGADVMGHIEQEGGLGPAGYLGLRQGGLQKGVAILLLPQVQFPLPGQGIRGFPQHQNQRYGAEGQINSHDPQHRDQRLVDQTHSLQNTDAVRLGYANGAVARLFPENRRGVCRGAGLRHGDIQYGKVLPQKLRIGGTQNFSGAGICHNDGGFFLHRHILNQDGLLAGLHILQKPLGLQTHLNQILSVLLPDHGVHHGLLPGGVGGDILTQGHVPVGKHGSEEANLLPVLHGNSIVFRIGAGDNGAAAVKQVQLIHLQIGGYPAQLLQIVGNFGAVLEDIGCGGAADDVVLLQGGYKAVPVCQIGQKHLCRAVNERIRRAVGQIAVAQKDKRGLYEKQYQNQQDDGQGNPHSKPQTVGTGLCRR